MKNPFPVAEKRLGRRRVSFVVVPAFTTNCVFRIICFKAYGRSDPLWLQSCAFSNKRLQFYSICFFLFCLCPKEFDGRKATKRSNAFSTNKINEHLHKIFGCPKMTKMVPRRLGPTCGGSFFFLGPTCGGSFLAPFLEALDLKKPCFSWGKMRFSGFAANLFLFHFFPRPGAILGHPGPSWAILGHLGAILGPSWDHPGPSWGHLV